MRKVKIKVESTITVLLDDGVDVIDFLDDVDFEPKSSRSDGDIVGYEVDDYEVLDSK